MLRSRSGIQKALKLCSFDLLIEGETLVTVMFLLCY